MTPNPVFIIACYRPRNGHDAALRELLPEFEQTLRANRLISDRPILRLQSADSTVIEIVEWVSRDAIDRARDNEGLRHMWAKLHAVCRFEAVGNLPESRQPFTALSALEPLPQTD